MMDDIKDSGREPIDEIKVGNILLEVYEKKNPKTGNIYYDYKSYRVYYTEDGQRRKGPYCQQRDLRDHAIALMEAMKLFSDLHRERKQREDD